MLRLNIKNESSNLRRPWMQVVEAEMRYFSYLRDTEIIEIPLLVLALQCGNP
jgi:hypothetical protein